MHPSSTHSECTIRYYNPKDKDEHGYLIRNKYDETIKIDKRYSRLSRSLDFSYTETRWTAERILFEIEFMEKEGNDYAPREMNCPEWLEHKNKSE